MAGGVRSKPIETAAGQVVKGTLQTKKLTLDTVDGDGAKNVFRMEGLSRKGTQLAVF